jgi:hypothetical protein
MFHVPSPSLTHKLFSLLVIILIYKRKKKKNIVYGPRAQHLKKRQDYSMISAAWLLAGGHKEE